MRDCQWQLPAFGHSNPRTVQEAPCFLVAREWHPACVKTTEAKAGRARIPSRPLPVVRVLLQVMEHASGLNAHNAVEGCTLKTDRSGAQ